MESIVKKLILHYAMEEAHSKNKPCYFTYSEEAGLLKTQFDCATQDKCIVLCSRLRGQSLLNMFLLFRAVFNNDYFFFEEGFFNVDDHEDLSKKQINGLYEYDSSKHSYKEWLKVLSTYNDITSNTITKHKTIEDIELDKEFTDKPATVYYPVDFLGRLDQVQ